MKILVVSLHHAIASSRYMTNAFMRLGHDVRHIGAETPYFDVDQHPERRWIPDAVSDQHVFSGWTPDLVAYLDCGENYYHHEGYANVPHIWCFDEGQICNDMPGMALYFHPSPTSPTALRCPDKFVNLQTAYDPTIHTPSLVPWIERKFDVVYAGRMPPRRILIIQALRDAGLVMDVRDLLFEGDYRDAYHQGRVAIVDHYHHFAPPMRFWEQCAMGLAVVALRFESLADLNPQGITVIPDERKDDMNYWIEAVKWAMQHPELAEASKHWVEPHTYDARAKLIVDTVRARGIVQ